MGRIFCIVGKSASGKDTIYKKIADLNYKRLIFITPYTTRPKRMDEVNGKNYFFVSKEQLNLYDNEGLVIEKREYLTTKDVWTYFTIKFDVSDNNDYILITTLQGAKGIINYFGEEKVHIIYLFLDNKKRLIRCIERESQQQNPDYLEVCRRFIADEADFSEDNLKQFKNIHYINTDKNVNKCMYEWEKLYYEKN